MWELSSAVLRESTKKFIHNSKSVSGENAINVKQITSSYTYVCSRVAWPFFHCVQKSVGNFCGDDDVYFVLFNPPGGAIVAGANPIHPSRGAGITVLFRINFNSTPTFHTCLEMLQYVRSSRHIKLCVLGFLCVGRHPYTSWRKFYVSNCSVPSA